MIKITDLLNDREIMEEGKARSIIRLLVSILDWLWRIWGWGLWVWVLLGIVSKVLEKVVNNNSSSSSSRFRHLLLRLLGIEDGRMTRIIVNCHVKSVVGEFPFFPLMNRVVGSELGVCRLKLKASCNTLLKPFSLSLIKTMWLLVWSCVSLSSEISFYPISKIELFTSK